MGEHPLRGIGLPYDSQFLSVSLMVHAEVRENAVVEDHWIAGEKFKRNLLKIQDIQEIMLFFFFFFLFLSYFFWKWHRVCVNRSSISCP